MLVVVLGYLALTIPRMNDLYVIDEAVFPYVAEGILKNGAPFYYNGELRPADFGLWHPPLYDYLLAGFVGIFGFSPISVRAFGVVCVLLAMIVLFSVLRRIMPTASQGAYIVLAALVLSSPQVISGALIPDIDGSFGLLVVVLTLWLATVVTQDRLSLRMALFVVAFATLTVATKFTISGFVAIIIGVAALLSDTRQWAKVFTVVGAFVVGSVLALGLLFLAGALIGFDARLPFDYLFGSLGSRTPGRGGVAGAIGTLLDGPGATLAWIGPAIMIAAIVASIAIPLRRVKGVDARLVGLMTGAGLFIVVGYAFISASPFQFPKYTPAAVPAFALAATALLSLLPHSVTGILRTARGAVILSAYALVLLGGTFGMFLLASRFERLHGRSVGDLALLTLGCAVAVALITVAALLFLRPIFVDRASMRSVVGSGVLITLVLTPVMVQTSSAAVNAVAPYATRYYYGERGMNAFVAEAEELIPAGVPIIGPKDIGFQVNRPFYEDAILFSWPLDKFRDFVADEEVSFVITRDKHDYSERIYPQYFAVIREYYEPILDSADSDFVLWQLKSH